MKKTLFTMLAVALATLSLGSYAASAASAPAGKAKSSRPVSTCPKGETGGIVTKNEMQGDTNVLTIRGGAPFRIRKSDDAATFEKQRAAKVGSLYCVHDDGQ